MTRKDFELIARVIREMPLQTEELRDYIAWQFAMSLVDTNPRFDGQRFQRACSPEQGR